MIANRIDPHPDPDLVLFLCWSDTPPTLVCAAPNRDYLAGWIACFRFLRTKRFSDLNLDDENGDLLTLTEILADPKPNGVPGFAVFDPEDEQVA